MWGLNRKTIKAACQVWQNIYLNVVRYLIMSMATISIFGKVFIIIFKKLMQFNSCTFDGSKNQCSKKAILYPSPSLRPCFFDMHIKLKMQFCKYANEFDLGECKSLVVKIVNEIA